MTTPATREDVLRRRLATQGVSRPAFDRPEEAVAFLGGVQGQELADTLWSVAMRVRDGTVADVRTALDDGRILRTHVLRDTWHLVARDDVRWLLEATSARVLQRNATSERRLGIDAAVVARSRDVAVAALEGGRSLTRPQLAAVLAEHGVDATGMRLAYVVMRLELDGLLCSGPAAGRQETYALLAERAPAARVLGHDEAVAELVRRFVTGHGPVSVRDLARWSSLTLAECRAGLAAVASELEHAVVEGVELWWAPGAPSPRDTTEAGYLLPGFDEVFAAHRDLGFVTGPAAAMGWGALFYRPLVVGLDVVGLWRRDTTRHGIVVQTADLLPLDAGRRRLLLDAADRWAAAAGVPVTVPDLT